jgi:hypothetical protein
VRDLLKLLTTSRFLPAFIRLIGTGLLLFGLLLFLQQFTLNPGLSLADARLDLNNVTFFTMGLVLVVSSQLFDFVVATPLRSETSQYPVPKLEPISDREMNSIARRVAKRSGRPGAGSSWATTKKVSSWQQLLLKHRLFSRMR